MCPRGSTTAATGPVVADTCASFVPTRQRRSFSLTSRPLATDVLAIGGTESSGGRVAVAMTDVAEDVQSVVLPGTGHWFAEQAPDALPAVLTTLDAALCGSYGSR